MALTEKELALLRAITEEHDSERLTNLIAELAKELGCTEDGRERPKEKAS